MPNPKLQVFPITEVAVIGRKLGILLIVDNTAAPLLARPFDHGAAIVVYSTTKYIGGHGSSIGGAIIDGGNFDWEAAGSRQPALTALDASYHGAVWVESHQATRQESDSFARSQSAAAVISRSAGRKDRKLASCIDRRGSFACQRIASLAAEHTGGKLPRQSSLSD
ncbi:hypothetical protein RLEG12_00205 (plasmid) [Rhizobium leguminosarum bv. trifolii CB782]|nr:hypothetical protein RLEG12_00205 [Rhizobium leguminosarum bv. trifolii CB782]